MKNLFMITVAAFFILSCTNNDAVEQENADIKIESKASMAFTDAVLRGWSDKKNCLRGYGDCAIAIIREGYPAEGLFAVRLELLGSTKMLMTYTSDEESEDEGGFLNFGNDTTLVSEVANDLGYSSIVVKAGMYEINRSENPKGQVILTIEAD